MLDLIFLLLMVIALVKAIKGDYNELLCNIAMVVGVIASILGLISAFFGDSDDSFTFGMLNILVLIISFVIRPAARHFAQLYQNKLDEQRRIIDEEIERAQANFNRPVTRDGTYIDNGSSSGTGSAPQGNVGLSNNQTLRNDSGTQENNFLPKN